VSLLFYKM